MGNHRATVGSTRPSVTPDSPYVGKRRATTVVEESVEVSSTGYVGKRRAAAPAPTPAPAPFVLTRESHETTTDPRIDTGQLRAIVEHQLEDTAPLPRLLAGQPAPTADQITVEVPEALAVPVAPLSPERAQAAEVVGLPAPLFSDDSAVDLPRISVAATYAADLSADTTTLLPVVTAGARRSVPAGRRRVSRRAPLPLLVGAAALVIAAGGAAATVGSPATPDDAGVRITTASALGGSSAIGGSGSTRTVPTSRDQDRTPSPKALAAQREQALQDLDAQATGQDRVLEENRWVLPVDGYRITNVFGQAASYYSSGYHTGLDFAAPTGTPIKSVARGTVTSAGWAGAYGNQTVVTLEDGTELWYCHQTEYSVSVGDEVVPGEVIGYVGTTGNSFGPHLHLEVRPGGGDPVDPRAALEQHGVTP